MTTQDFFLFGSTIRTIKAANSDCERSAEATGKKKLKTGPCPVPDRNTPICVTSIYMEVLEQYPDGRCRIEITVCYTYSYSEMKKRINAEPLTQYRIMLGSKNRFQNASSLSALPDTFEKGFLLRSNPSGSDIVEDTITFTLHLYNGLILDAVLIADTYTGTKFSSLLFDKITCSDEIRTELDPLIKKVRNYCDWCVIELQGLSQYEAPLVRVLDKSKNIINSVISHGDTIEIKVPCEMIYKGGSITVQPRGRQGVVKTIEISPSILRLSDDAHASRQPVVTVTPNPTPEHPCRYKVRVKTDIHGGGTIYLMKGRLTTNQYANFQSLYNNGLNWQGTPPKLGPLEIVSSIPVDSVPPSSFFFKRTITATYELDGPEEFTVVASIGTCHYAIPVKLSCNIQDKLKDDLLPRSNDSIKVDTGNEWTSDSVPSNSSTGISAVYSAPYIEEEENNTKLAMQGRYSELTNTLGYSSTLSTPRRNTTIVDNIPLKTKLWPVS